MKNIKPLLHNFLNTKAIFILLYLCVDLHFFSAHQVFAQEAYKNTSSDEQNNIEKKSEIARRVIEEVYVTAQKKEEAVTDVPISMSVITDTFIAEQGLTEIADVLRFTPNVKLDEGSGLIGGQPKPNCRGFRTNETTRSFESPCGIALDGIPYARPAYFGAALFDVQRVEVLRGPQGTTFGKNTTAGLVHLITKDPNSEFTGNAQAQYGDLDRRRIEAALGGPVIPGFLNFRFAGFRYERDGYMKNTTAKVAPEPNERGGIIDQKGYRIKLEFPDLVGSTLKLTYENVNLVSKGTTLEWFDVSPQMAEYSRSFDPNADFEKDNFINSNFNPIKSTTELRRFQVDWVMDVMDWDLYALAGSSKMVNPVRLGFTGSAIPMNKLFTIDKNPSETFEFRVSSPDFPGLFGLKRVLGIDLGNSNFLSGVFYQKSGLKPSHGEGFVNTAVFAGFLAAQQTSGTALPGSIFGAVPGDELNAILEQTNSDEQDKLIQTYIEDRETKAIFTQLQWKLNQQWSLQAGMRYSEEIKEAKWNQVADGPAVETVGWTTFKEELAREESNFQPKATINYSPTDDIQLFLHWAKGFKGGGFNSTAYDKDLPHSPLEYGPETVAEWGLDAKTRLLDGTMQLNLSLFRLDLDDYQVLTTTTPEPPHDQSPFAAALTVVNAGKARAQGAEADLTYLFTDWLTVMAAVGLNDTEFIEFRNGSCPPGVSDSDGDGNPSCDQSGKSFAFAPKWNATFTLNLSYPMSFIGLDNIHLTGGPTIEYYSSQMLAENQHEPNRVSSFYLLKASIGLNAPTQGWSFRITGENLTDENTPTSLSVRPSHSTQTVRLPRHIYAQARWEF